MSPTLHIFPPSNKIVLNKHAQVWLEVVKEYKSECVFEGFSTLFLGCPSSPSPMTFCSNHLHETNQSEGEDSLGQIGKVFTPH
jgi:hypothetical protein